MSSEPRNRTEQEEFWAGEFGDAYVDRNQGEALVASNTALFARVLRSAGRIGSVLEFGANIGLNLLAFKNLLPSVELTAVEINRKAAVALERISGVRIHPVSIFEYQPEVPKDLVLSKGVLIHLAPEKLPAAYDLLYRSSGHYVCLVEYYHPIPVEIPYRGHQRKAFKRDFAGEMLQQFPALRLLDYGFVYHRDPVFPQDDVNWFLLEKTGQSKP